MFNLDAAVHDRVQPSLARQLVRLFIDHTDLLPQAARAHGNGLASNGQHVLGPPEHIHHIHWKRYIGQIGVTVFTQHISAGFGIARIDRHYAVAMVLHVFAGKKTRPMPFGRKAHHRNRAAAAKDAAELVYGVHGTKYALEICTWRDAASGLYPVTKCSHATNGNFDEIAVFEKARRRKAATRAFGGASGDQVTRVQGREVGDVGDQFV